MCRSDRGRPTSRTGRRVEYAASAEESPVWCRALSGRHVEPRLKGWSLLSSSVGATSRLVATTLKLESVRVASRLDAPGPGSCLGQPCVPTCSFLSILQKGERKNYSVLQSTHFPALLCYIHVSKTQNVPTHFLSRTTTRRRDPAASGRPA